jgi:hypothetical protein
MFEGNSVKFVCQGDETHFTADVSKHYVQCCQNQDSSRKSIKYHLLNYHFHLCVFFYSLVGIIQGYLWLQKRFP